MSMPVEYEGREQSYLKHRVLEQYLIAWAQKQGSNARFREVKLVYVDCFSGPWMSRDERLHDTSVYIGLNALAVASRTWRTGIKVKAVFVERDDEAFERLDQYLASHKDAIEKVAIHGEFGANIDRIQREIGTGAAFLFIDPTGWKGVAMKFIAPLAREKRRDVMINVMFNDVNRFKDDQRGFLREQMKDFFGLEEEAIPPGLDEDALLDFYREQLRRACGLPYVANLAIPHPTQDRTWFHLVVGGHHHEVLRLFRQVELKVCGGEASEVRAGARGRTAGQAEMAFDKDLSFNALRSEERRRAQVSLENRPSGTRASFREVWTEILAGHHLTRGDVVETVRELAERKRLTVSPVGRRAIEDDASIVWT